MPLLACQQCSVFPTCWTSQQRHRSSCYRLSTVPVLRADGDTTNGIRHPDFQEKSKFVPGYLPEAAETLHSRQRVCGISAHLWIFLAKCLREIRPISYTRDNLDVRSQDCHETTALAPAETAMPAVQEFLLGEFQRTLDERYRLSIPNELGDALVAESADCILAKERPGCLSLWSAAVWQTRLDEGVELVKQKMRAGKLQERIGQVQLFGRLLSTRHRPVQLAGRGRLVIPEGFRPFLGVEPGGEVQIIGAAVCIEIWSPAAWLKYLEGRMPRFRRLFDQLSR